MEWHKYPDEKPKIDDEFLYLQDSIEVLITNGEKLWLGCLESYQDNEYEPVWRESGRDGYIIEIDENIIYWAYLPKPPKTS